MVVIRLVICSMRGILTVACPLRMTRENERCTVLILDFSIRSITSLLWGIPRSAYRLALNDDVGRKVLVIILNRTRSLTITASS